MALSDKEKSLLGRMAALDLGGIYGARGMTPEDANYMIRLMQRTLVTESGGGYALTSDGWDAIANLRAKGGKVCDHRWQSLNNGEQGRVVCVVCHALGSVVPDPKPKGDLEQARSCLAAHVVAAHGKMDNLALAVDQIIVHLEKKENS